LIDHATEIRLYAERRLGEMMAEQPKAKGAREVGYKEEDTTRVSGKPATLSDVGIDKNLANRARTAAAMSQEQFEAKVTEAKKSAVATLDRVTAEDKAGRRAQREGQKRVRRHWRAMQNELTIHACDVTLQLVALRVIPRPTVSETAAEPLLKCCRTDISCRSPSLPAASGKAMGMFVTIANGLCAHLA
jgi:hypothetical protein